MSPSSVCRVQRPDSAPKGCAAMFKSAFCATAGVKGPSANAAEVMKKMHDMRHRTRRHPSVARQRQTVAPSLAPYATNSRLFTGFFDISVRSSHSIVERLFREAQNRRVFRNRGTQYRQAQFSKTNGA